MYFRTRAVSLRRARVEVDEADDGGDAARGLGDRLHRALVGLEELRVLDEVADAVAGQRQFRRDDEVGAFAAAAAAIASRIFAVLPSMSALVGLIWARATRMPSIAW